MDDALPFVLLVSIGCLLSHLLERSLGSRLLRGPSRGAKNRS